MLRTVGQELRRFDLDGQHDWLGGLFRWVEFDGLFRIVGLKGVDFVGWEGWSG